MSAAAPDRERDVQRRIVALARTLGFFVSDLSQGYRPGGRRHSTTRQTPGVPDLYLAHPERRFRIWVEVKGPKGNLSEKQRAWHAKVGAAGARIWTCSSVAEFAAHLEPYGWEVAA
ncbi:VRR-NUC domain-containing protein [Candidatus Palauibacter sp.]|uniref:VRR-NUC domain-containing protein n=1 Tax=Candidatus Palauibacter sp. TaxID=3101350 RepID=UPI003CC5B19C